MTMQTVYDIATGEAHSIEAVDAREYVASGSYSADPPDDTQLMGGPIQPAAPGEHAPRKPGRPKKTPAAAE